jgi:uncharacterized protein YeeX (DUF496 family)
VLRKLRERVNRNIGKRESLLRELYDHLASPKRGESISAVELCDLLEEWVKVDMTEAEVETVLDIMDIDQDGRVSLDDFMVSGAAAADAIHL